MRVQVRLRRLLLFLRGENPIGVDLQKVRLAHPHLPRIGSAGARASAAAPLRRATGAAHLSVLPRLLAHVLVEDELEGLDLAALGRERQGREALVVEELQAPHALRAGPAASR